VPVCSSLACMPSKRSRQASDRWVNSGNVQQCHALCVVPHALSAMIALSLHWKQQCAQSIHQAGRADLLEVDDAVLHEHYKSEDIDLSDLLTPAATLRPGAAQRCVTMQDHGLDTSLDVLLMEEAASVLGTEAGATPAPITISAAIQNTHRATGTQLSYEISKRFGEEGLPEKTITCDLTGHAGQSLGAWLAKGVELHLTGDSNDYVGKGLSGGVISVRPPADAPFVASEQVRPCCAARPSPVSALKMDVTWVTLSTYFPPELFPWILPTCSPEVPPKPSWRVTQLQFYFRPTLVHGDGFPRFDAAVVSQCVHACCVACQQSSNASALPISSYDHFLHHHDSVAARCPAQQHASALMPGQADVRDAAAFS
jgi:hypothetical protein